MEKNNPLRRMRYLMGCFIEVEISGLSQESADRAVEAAFEEMKRIEALLSKFSSESMVSSINDEASKKPVPLTEEVFNLIEKALKYSELTEGAFDMTVEPLTEIWKIAYRRGYIPSGYEIGIALDQVGYSNVVLNKAQKTIYFKKPGIKIDLGALGKGYAIDRAVTILREHGVQNAIVNAGSTIFCLGNEARFGIEHPIRLGEIADTVKLKDKAVSTSGDYERFYEIGGKKYGHIIHPKTGWPVETSLLSASLVGDSAMDCDILSTIYFILDPQKSSAKASLWRKISGGKFVESTISKSSKSNPGATVQPISAKL